MLKILPIQYLNNYIKLVAAIAIFLQSSIRDMELKNAREYIILF